MSEQAKAALISVGTNRQGATPPPTTTLGVLAELKSLGFLGGAGGLTRRGTIRREDLVLATLDELF